MTDLFTDDNSGETPKGTGTESTEDLLSQLVGEGKKFKTAADLARGKLEADKFIDNLKSEMQEMREKMGEYETKLTKSRTLEEVLSEMNKARGGESGDDNTSTINEDILEQTVSRIVSERESTKTRAANYAASQAKVLERFGNDEAKAREFVRTEAKRLGLTTDELRSLGETSPEAFSRLLNLNPTRGSGPTIRSDVNTEASNFNNGAVRNKAYYDKLKAELGQKFWEPKIQQQRFRDRQALGSKYFE